MRIHRVRQGETLDSIAQLTGVSVRDIVRVNELSDTQVIVSGLNLLIPQDDPLAVQSYTVQSGDTVASISEKFGLTATEFEDWTGISGPGSVPKGRRLYFPTRVTTKKTIEVNGYLLPQGTQSDAQILQTVKNMTYVCAFSYQARPDGSIEPLKDNIMIKAAKQYGIRPLMTLTNFDGNTFSTSMAHTIMANRSIRRRLIDRVLSACAEKGYKGVNVDFEHMQPSDRPLYNTFIRELRDALHARSLSISIAMGPKTGDNPNQSWMGAFDYQTLGKEVDFLMLMTYEWGWVGGPPLAGILQQRRHKGCDVSFGFCIGLKVCS